MTAKGACPRCGHFALQWRKRKGNYKCLGCGRIFRRVGIHKLVELTKGLRESHDRQDN